MSERTDLRVQWRRRPCRSPAEAEALAVLAQEVERALQLIGKAVDLLEGGGETEAGPG